MTDQTDPSAELIASGAAVLGAWWPGWISSALKGEWTSATQPVGTSSPRVRASRHRRHHTHW